MQVLLTRGVIGKAYEFRIALLGDMDVVEGIGAAHVERARRALGPHHAEAREKFFHAIEIGRPQPPIGNVAYLEPGHALASRANAVRESFAQTSRAVIKPHVS